MIELVSSQVSGTYNSDIDYEIEELSRECFDLSAVELSQIGLITGYAKNY